MMQGVVTPRVLLKLHPFRRLLRPLVAATALLLAYEADIVARGLVAIGLSESVADRANHAVMAAGLLALTWLVSRVIWLAVAMVMVRRGRHPSRLLRQLITAILCIAVSLVILSTMSESAMAGALATSGILVAIIGFALRNVIGDLFSGIALSIERPYRIGDWIEADTGITGRVVDITWRATRIETRNKVHVVVPNGRMAVGRLINYSAPHPHFRTQLTVVLDFDVPVARAKRVLLAAVMATKCIRADPKPDVRVDAYTDRGIRYLVRYWLSSFADDADCRDAVLANIDRHLRLAGISIANRDHVVVERPGRRPHVPAASPVEALAHIPGFQTLPAEVIRQLAPALSLRMLAAGEVLRPDAGGSEDVGIVSEGLLVLRDERGIERAVIEPGMMIGQLMHATSAAGFHVAAATDAVLLVLAVGRLKTTRLEASPLGDVLREGLRQWQMLLEPRRTGTAPRNVSGDADPPGRPPPLFRLRRWIP